MNNKFDELAKNLAQSVTRALLCLFAAAQFAAPALANDFKRGPLVQLSDPDPLSGCEVGFPTVPDAPQVEPFIAVNPANPKNIVAVWIAGNAKGVVAATTFDGGKRWQQVVIPGLNQCAGGPFNGAVDPWLSFAPNGDLYLVSLPFVGLDLNAIAVNKSTDGGLHWSSPIILEANTDTRFAPDKPSITADSINARFVYATWVQFANGNRASVRFARTTDAGQSWEPAREIFNAGTSDQVMGPTVVVLPDGTVLNFFVELLFSNGNGGAQKDGRLAIARSTDNGQTWSAPTRVGRIPVFNVTDPDTGADVISSSSYQPFFRVAVDPHNGRIYAVWEDTRFSNGQYSSIAFTASADGGLNWSAPIAVNKTPTNLAAENRQAWMPSIAVAADGTIGVTYYDFRNNTLAPGLPTDYWLVHCHPTLTTPASNPASWNSETRLTDVSFDLEKSANLFGSYFLGDYMGLAAVGNDFVTAFNQPSASDPGSIFFRRVGP